MSDFPTTTDNGVAEPVEISKVDHPTDAYSNLYGGILRDPNLLVNVEPLSLREVDGDTSSLRRLFQTEPGNFWITHRSDLSDARFLTILDAYTREELPTRDERVALGLPADASRALREIVTTMLGDSALPRTKMIAQQLVSSHGAEAIQSILVARALSRDVPLTPASLERASDVKLIDNAAGFYLAECGKLPPLGVRWTARAIGSAHWLADIGVEDRGAVLKDFAVQTWSKNAERLCRASKSELFKPFAPLESEVRAQIAALLVSQTDSTQVLTTLIRDLEPTPATFDKAWRKIFAASPGTGIEVLTEHIDRSANPGKLIDLAVSWCESEVKGNSPTSYWDSIALTIGKTINLRPEHVVPLVARTFRHADAWSDKETIGATIRAILEFDPLLGTETVGRALVGLTGDAKTAVMRSIGDVAEFYPSVALDLFASQLHARTPEQRKVLADTIPTLAKLLPEETRALLMPEVGRRTNRYGFAIQFQTLLEFEPARAIALVERSFDAAYEKPFGIVQRLGSLLDVAPRVGTQFVFRMDPTLRNDDVRTLALPHLSKLYEHEPEATLDALVHCWSSRHLSDPKLIATNAIGFAKEHPEVAVELFKNLRYAVPADRLGDVTELLTLAPEDQLLAAAEQFVKLLNAHVMGPREYVDIRRQLPRCSPELQAAIAQGMGGERPSIKSTQNDLDDRLASVAGTSDAAYGRDPQVAEFARVAVSANHELLHSLFPSIDPALGRIAKDKRTLQAFQIGNDLLPFDLSDDVMLLEQSTLTSSGESWTVSVLNTRAKVRHEGASMDHCIADNYMTDLARPDYSNLIAFHLTGLEGADDYTVTLYGDSFSGYELEEINIKSNGLGHGGAQTDKSRAIVAALLKQLAEAAKIVEARELAERGLNASPVADQRSES